MGLHLTVEKIAQTGVSENAARKIAQRLRELPNNRSATELWDELTRTILTPEVPFALHSLIYETIYKDWDRTQGPPPAWIPSARAIEASNVAAFGRRVGIGSREDLHRWSAENRAEFWQHIIETLGIHFKKRPREILDTGSGVETPEWLVGAELNIADSCFRAPGDAPAIVHPAAGGLQTVSYDALDRLSNRVANGLGGIGVRRGDAVAIAMPMTVEAVAAYLGVVKAGAVVVSIADSFSAAETATRLRIARAQTVITQDVILRGGKTLPMFQKVADAGAKTAVVIAGTGSLGVELRGGDVSWEKFLSDDDEFDTVACGPDDASNVLFSSGTTGEPKAIPWTHSTPIKCAADGFLHQDIQKGDVVAWPTNIGWMMGPWLIYASLVNRATMALFYDAPVTREFCEFVQNARVRMLGVVPSLVKAWRSTGVTDGLDWRSVKLFSSTGEASNAEDYLFLMSRAGYRPVIEYCGGTEIGGGYITGALVHPCSPAAFSTPAYGLDFYILDDDGKPVDDGELFLVPPSIGLSTRLLNRDHHEVYYDGTPKGPRGETLRRHGDQVQRLGGGYYRAQGRADDTMNLSGIKVGAAEIERAVSGLEGVVEAAAIAVSPPGGGPSRLVVFAVVEAGVPAAGDLLREMQRVISKNLNPLFKIHDVVVVDALPRTASNKVMRRRLRDRYDASKA